MHFGCIYFEGVAEHDMHLTIYTDYSLRVMLMLAVAQNRLVTIKEIAERYDISRNHLVKVVQQLAAHGYIESVRGRHGGVRLGRPAAGVTLGELARLTEENFNLVECFDRDANQCLISPVCRLRRVFANARDKFLQDLDAITLAELTASPASLRKLLFEPASDVRRAARDGRTRSQ
jgi:Rrf2 family nitric oxide-sensitive transcriptional repressor